MRELRLRYEGSPEPSNVSGLELPVVAFRSPNLPLVELRFFGLIHVADSSYYAQLNSRMSDFDRVYFEAVLPQDAIDQEQFRHEVNDLTSLKRSDLGDSLGLDELLGLVPQFPAISVRHQRFVHADISVERFNVEARRLGYEGFTGLLESSSRLTKTGNLFDWIQQRWRGPKEFFGAVSTGEVFYRIRQRFCVEMSNDQGIPVYDGIDLLLHIREAVVLKKLTEYLLSEDLSVPRSVAILYGTGHLSSMAGKLQQQLGFFPVIEQTQWLTAVETSPEQRPTEDHFRAVHEIFKH